MVVSQGDITMCWEKHSHFFTFPTQYFNSIFTSSWRFFLELSKKIVITFQENSRTTGWPKWIIVAAMWIENWKKADHARYRWYFSLKRYWLSVDNWNMLDPICLNYIKAFRGTSGVKKLRIRKPFVRRVRKLGKMSDSVVSKELSQ